MHSPAVGPTQWVPRFFAGSKRSGHEVNHTSPSCAEIENQWSYTSTPPICRTEKFLFIPSPSVWFTDFVCAVGVR